MIEGYDNKLLQSFEYETTAISNKKIIGTCELGKATIQLINDSNNYSDLKKTWIKTKFGSFYIYDVEPVQEKVNIKLNCYDIKYKLDTEYDSSLYTWPQTLKEWRNAIFENCGVEYEDSDFPNSDLVLTSEPNIGTAKFNRQVLCIIAQAGASWIETDENDIFKFKWFTINEFIAKDWSSLTTEKTPTDEVNLTILGRGDVEDIVYYPKVKPENPIEFKIDNNYILDPQDTDSTNDLRETTIIPIYERVKGFSYIVYELTSTQIANKLSLKLGDKITYIDIWGNKLTSYVMSRTISYIGGDVNDDDNYQITLSAEEIEETNTDLSVGIDVISEISEVSIKADKANEQIILLNQSVKDNDEKISSIEMTTDGINSQVSQTITEITDLQEKINTIQSTILEQTNEAFTMWFEKTGLQNTIDTIQDELENNTSDSNTLKEYIHFEGAEITLGKSDSQTKLVIRNDRISFMTGEIESAYISENTLYITDSTILNKLMVGHWETAEDDYGNLNTKWVGDE